MSDTKLLVTPISFLVNRLPDTYVAPFQPSSYTPLLSVTLGSETGVQTGKQQEAAAWKIIAKKELYRFEKGVSYKFTQKPVKPNNNLPSFVGKEEARDMVRIIIRHDAYYLTGTFNPYGLPCAKKRTIYVKMEDHANKYKALIKIAVSLEAFGVDPCMFEAGERVSNVAVSFRRIGEVLKDGVLVLKKVKEGREECTVYQGIREAIEKELQTKESTVDITLCVFKGSYAWHKPIVVPTSAYNVNINIIGLNKCEIVAPENMIMFYVDYLTEISLNFHKITIPFGTTTLFLKNSNQRKIACAIHANFSEVGDIKADGGDITQKVANREGMRLHGVNENLAPHASSFIATIYHSKYSILTEFFGALITTKGQPEEGAEEGLGQE